MDRKRLATILENYERGMSLKDPNLAKPQAPAPYDWRVFVFAESFHSFHAWLYEQHVYAHQQCRFIDRPEHVYGYSPFDACLIIICIDGWWRHPIQHDPFVRRFIDCWDKRQQAAQWA